MGNGKLKRGSARSRPWVAVALLALVATFDSACSSDSHPPNASIDQAVSQWCSAYCSWRRGCGDAVALTCSTQCRSAGGFADYGRVEFYQAMANCLADNADCPGGGEQSWNVCFEEASLSTPLPQTAYEFCEGMGELFFECGYGIAPSTCARNYISLNDEMLSAIEVCSAQSCETYQDCVSAIAYGGS